MIILKVINAIVHLIALTFLAFMTLLVMMLGSVVYLFNIMKTASETLKIESQFFWMSPNDGIFLIPTGQISLRHEYGNIYASFDFVWLTKWSSVELTFRPQLKDA